MRIMFTWNVLSDADAEAITAIDRCRYAGATTFIERKQWDWRFGNDQHIE